MKRHIAAPPTPEQQRRDRPLAHREGQRHQPLVVKHQMRRVEQVHARLLGDLRRVGVGGAERRAERSEGAVMPRRRGRNRRRTPRRQRPRPAAAPAAASRRRNNRRSAGAAARRRAVAGIRRLSRSGEGAAGEQGERIGETAERRLPALPTDRRCRGRAARTSHRRCAAGWRAAVGDAGRGAQFGKPHRAVSASARAQRNASCR